MTSSWTPWTPWAPWLPAIVALANNIGVAILAAPPFAPPTNYSSRLLALQIAMVLATTLLASRRTVVLFLGLVLTLGLIWLSFDLILLFIPTAVAALWGFIAGISRYQKYD